MGEFIITIHCIVPGNIEEFTPQEVFNECMSRICRNQKWKLNDFTNSHGEGNIKRIK